ncbi:MAG: toll/interleukin-1 receptor domain-containing protein [Gemmatimonadales bacterium]
MAGRNSTDALFSQYDLRSALENQDRELAKAVEGYPADRLQQEFEEELVAHFTQQIRVDVPVLTEGAMSVAAEETEVDVRHDFDRAVFDRSQPALVPGIEVTYYVPFTGDANLFKFVASTRSFNPPYADVVGQELRFKYARADSDVAQTKAAFEAELNKVRQHLSWISNDTSMYNSTLGSKIRAKIAERRGRLEKKNAGIQALGIPLRQSARPNPAPGKAVQSSAKQKPTEPSSYDVALSFAGENRAYVEQVAELLRKAGVSVFYDGFEQAILWGKNLIDHLAEIYRHRSRFVVMFVSKHYVEKAFPTHERQHAQARALLAKEEYILPARFDDTEVPGMTTTVAYVDLRRSSPEQLVELILAKIGHK